VVVDLQGHTGSAGQPLPHRVVAALAGWAATQSGDVVTTDRLPLAAPNLGVPADLASGVLALHLPDGQFVLWTRGEQVHTVDWGGDPHNKALAEREGDSVRLSPRKSFDRWQATQRNRSEPWAPAQLAEAGDLRATLLEALYARSRRVARAALTLQRSLLSEPPAPDHLEVAVRYVPAAQDAQVGGDWYDVFQQPDGATALVIGDVVGHDTEASASMGHLRGLVRGISYDRPDSPADILTRLDRAMEGLELETLATVVVARLEQTPAEFEQGITRLRWSNAGHPPPVVLFPDGTTEVLARTPAELLLGVRVDAVRRDHVVTLPRGSTVLLYTDGLVERRDQEFDVGIARLCTELPALLALSTAALTDALLASVLPEHAEDDVALIAVRLNRQPNASASS
jgi:serine phosphatase RsbU (regulator of sigma subunit)